VPEVLDRLANIIKPRAGAFIAAAAGLWKSIRTSDARGLLTLAFPLFGCGFVAAGFIREKRKALEIPTAALAATTSDKPLQSTSAAGSNDM
jgi:hypothetical protein